MSQQAAVSIPTFAQFVRLMQKEVSKELKGADVVPDHRQLVIIKDDKTTHTFSLDKLYRFYVDDIMTHKDFTSKQLVACVKMFMNKHLAETNRAPLFKMESLQRISPVCVLEQCCIR
jgi:hypothetical protein